MVVPRAHPNQNLFHDLGAGDDVAFRSPVGQAGGEQQHAGWALGPVEGGQLQEVGQLVAGPFDVDAHRSIFPAASDNAPLCEAAPSGDRHVRGTGLTAQPTNLMHRQRRYGTRMAREPKVV